jgi:hypothetical protein
MHKKSIGERPLFRFTKKASCRSGNTLYTVILRTNTSRCF